MWKLVRKLEYIRTYLDDLLILSNEDFKFDLIKLEMVLARLFVTGMKIDAEKFKFLLHEIEYLGYWIALQSDSTGKQKSGGHIAMLNHLLLGRNCVNSLAFSIIAGTCTSIEVTYWPPLTEPLSDKNKFQWLPQHITAFEISKRL
jgi:hypothetical protein